jgi:hypothetical protein
MENISHSKNKVLGKDFHAGLSNSSWHALTVLLISVTFSTGQIWVGTNAFQVAKPLAYPGPPPRIPKFLKSWAKFPVPWNIHL